MLVGGLDHFLFFHILGIITPTDFHIFQRDWNHQPECVLHILHPQSWIPVMKNFNLWLLKPWNSAGEFSELFDSDEL